MRTFAQKSKATLQTELIKSPKSGRMLSRHSSGVHPIFHLHRTIGNKAVQRLLGSREENPKTSLVGDTSTGVYDLGQTPLHDRPVDTANKTAQVRRTYHMETVPNSSSFEATIAPSGAAASEEMTVAGGGDVSTPILQRTSTYCQCTPTSASIKNVKKYTNGKLYGHEFDFVVDLTYSKLGGSATKHNDCSLEWWEKTTRPPAWQTVIKKNSWHDMFALYPTSPTFDGWTKNRTKPCPGKETAKVHDPPAASVDLPARTLWFNLKVKGGGTTKSATGAQVLEPDGKGGIKTQTFTVP